MFDNTRCGLSIYKMKVITNVVYGLWNQLCKKAWIETLYSMCGKVKLKRKSYYKAKAKNAESICIFFKYNKNIMITYAYAILVSSASFSEHSKFRYKHHKMHSWFCNNEISTIVYKTKSFFERLRSYVAPLNWTVSKSLFLLIKMFVLIKFEVKFMFSV